MNTQFLFALIPTIAVVLLILGFYKTVFERKDQAQEHIQELSTGKPVSSGNPLSRKQTDAILKRRKKKKEDENFFDRLDTQLERANMAINPNEFVLISLGAGIAGILFLKIMLGQNIVFAILGGIASVFLPMLYMKIKTFMRMQKAATQFPDVIEAMVNGFKTGYGFSKCVQMVSENFTDPWGTEYGKMSAELNLGLTVEDALGNFSKRIPSPDVDLFVTAILIQKETGGNMSELLGNLSKTCRDRLKLFQKVSALSAQGRLSAGILCCVPFLLFGMMCLFLNEATMKFVTNPIGIIMLIITGFWMVCGIFVLFKIAKIEV